MCVELYIHSPNIPSLCGAQLKHRHNLTFTLTLKEVSDVLVKIM